MKYFQAAVLLDDLNGAGVVANADRVWFAVNAPMDFTETSQILDWCGCLSKAAANLVEQWFAGCANAQEALQEVEENPSQIIAEYRPDYWAHLDDVNQSLSLSMVDYLDARFIEQCRTYAEFMKETEK